MNYKLLISILLVAIVWGTTFLGIKIGVETVPPWYVAGFRQLLAGIILFLFLWSTKKLRRISRQEFWFQIMISFFIFVGANGLTTVAEQHLTSSLTSLLSSLSPIFIFLGSVSVGIEKISGKVITGLLMGFFGIIFIFWDGIKELSNPQYLTGILTLILALISWTLGVLFFKKKESNPDNLLIYLLYQFLFAGVFQIFLGVIFSEKIELETWSIRSIIAIIYLAVFGSVITYYAYYYLLDKLLPTQVSMLSYINTVLSIFLGWWILNEEISLKFIIATVLIISGVFVMNFKASKFLKRKS